MSQEWLLNKYGIEYQDNVLYLLNIYHTQYLKQPAWNTLEDLKKYFAEMSIESQQIVCEIASIYYVRDLPFEEIAESCRTPRIVNIIFEKLESIAKVSSEQIAVSGFVHQSLCTFINNSDNKVQEILRNREKMNTHIKQNIHIIDVY